MGKKGVVDESTVQVISMVGNLPLAKDRERVIAPPLSEWIEDANKLNSKLSAEKFREIVPSTVFNHPR